MRTAYDVEAVRSAEAALAAGLPDGTLMDRAAAGIAAGCARLLGGAYGARVVLLVGSGDNGGDALHAGARLARRGARVDALALGGRQHPGGAAALRAAGGRLHGPGEGLDLLDDADLVLDGIVGIGGSGGLRPEAARAVARAEGSAALLVAVDVPSGVDAATGEAAGAAVHADVTLAPGALKPGLLVDPGATYAGLVEVVDIGLGPWLGAPAVEALDADDVAALLPVPGPDADKYSRGVVGVVAGSDEYPGAAVLCAGAAVRGGAGMVRYVGPGHATDRVLARWPEVVAGGGRVQARVIGPGIPELDAVLDQVARPEPVVLDAAAATAYARAGGPALLTPHAGELVRVLAAAGLEVGRGQVEARTLHFAREAARRTGCVVLLKGSTTVVAAPDGRARVNPTGTPWLATAGSGDVLAGLAGALLAGGLDAYDAGSVAAWVHGLAGRLAADGAPTSASAVLDALPGALRATLR
ncbi:NAD(P)H-hydrate dehydratase [Motilibacter aurantiacus]|uniref:NAD(P)H-hydrate dehydratase n=1 Tax=Motilibacter aurantiacus TaxID=2714955 RepID=UPI0014080747|nr:NAD(P)H-hydrate dehydratase [Motilibacter aurantiacus]NHC44023.1 NAD(P)H-hydrate dehydratase [Motilibacter aurantiacus]